MTSSHPRWLGWRQPSVAPAPLDLGGEENQVGAGAEQAFLTTPARGSWGR